MVGIVLASLLIDRHSFTMISSPSTSAGIFLPRSSAKSKHLKCTIRFLSITPVRYFLLVRAFPLFHVPGTALGRFLYGGHFLSRHSAMRSLWTWQRRDWWALLYMKKTSSRGITCLLLVSRVSDSSRVEACVACVLIDILFARS